MKNSIEIQITLKSYMAKLKEEYQIARLGMFGSYVRNEQTPASDLDLLVTFQSTPSLFKFVALENYLSDLLGVKVDLVMESALKPRIGEYIRKELIEL